MIENTTNLIREKNNNIAEMTEKCHFKMNLDTQERLPRNRIFNLKTDLDAQERLPRNRIFNLKTNRSQFFSLSSRCFLSLGFVKLSDL